MPCNHTFVKQESVAGGGLTDPRAKIQQMPKSPRCQIAAAVAEDSRVLSCPTPKRAPNAADHGRTKNRRAGLLVR